MTEEASSRNKGDIPESGGKGPEAPAPATPVKKRQRVRLSRQKWDAIKVRARQSGEYLDLLQRSRADFDNYRKRMNRERVEVARAAQGDIAFDLLTVVDNLERALVAARANCHGNPFLRGLEMIHKEFVEKLAARGIVPMVVVGKPFNPDEHQAMEYVETAEYPPDTVVREMRRGYLMDERVLRPAMVSVAKLPAGSGTGPPAVRAQVTGLAVAGERHGSQTDASVETDSARDKEGARDGKG